MIRIALQYDLSTTTYSTDGRVFQVEYAAKAVDISGTVVALRCRDGIVFAVEKMVQSKMLVEGSNRRIQTVASHVGMACAGMQADARQLVNRARQECDGYKNNYGMDIPGNVLNERMAAYMHLFTVYWTVRPFGASALMGVRGRQGYELYLLEPSGTAYRYFATAIGKAKQAAKTELEKLNLEELSARDALFEVSKIIHQVHDEVKDKEFELELSWICDETEGIHRLVPKEMRDEISARAKAAIEEDDEEDEESSEEES
jgi:20S proteasome subunit alpha 7